MQLTWQAQEAGHLTTQPGAGGGPAKIRQRVNRKIPAAEIFLDRPAQRDNVYDVLRVHDGPESPDLRVRDWSAHRARRLHTQNAASDAGLEVSSAPLAVTVSARAPDAAPVRST